MTEYRNWPEDFFEDEEVLKHQRALTRENLHGKFDIAIELGWRDKQLTEARAEIERLKANFSDKAKAVLSLNVKLRKHREFVATPARRGS